MTAIITPSQTPLSAQVDALATSQRALITANETLIAAADVVLQKLLGYVQSGQPAPPEDLQPIIDLLAAMTEDADGAATKTAAAIARLRAPIPTPGAAGKS